MPKLDFPFILHGGDYNPEQWPEEVWDRDMELMKKAGVNIATLPVFGWGNIQKDEDTWDFGWLDRIIEKLHANDVRLCLATATAATPPWLDQKYPDVLRTERDGRKCKHGSRHTFCPHSENFRRLSTGLARAMAERYGKHPALLLWHVSNEYGNPCYCDACSAAFRTWLEKKYGSLDEVNHRWNMAFWGQTYTDWSQIEAPQDLAQRNFQGLMIDYDRFQSDSILECCRGEIAVLREVTPEIPITTNMMGAFKPLDYHRWAKELDVVSWDSYPARNASPADIAFRHSLMRGLKDGEPWMLMEQTPSQQNWQAYNSLKRPGIMRLWSFQAMAHGADAIMYFQWRRSPGAQEMFHGAVVEHAGREDARVFQEVSALGKELQNLEKETVGGRVEAEVALVFDWENWWAVEYSSGPSILANYCDACLDYFRAFFELGITVDVVSADADLSRYKLVVAPMLKMIKPGFAERIQTHLDGGGTFLTTYFSGIVDESDRAFPNGYPGPLSNILGIWVEETDALSPDESNSVRVDGETYPCGMLCDRIHLEGAEAIGIYVSDFYAGEPALTRNGKSFYHGTKLSPEGLIAVLADLASEINLRQGTGDGVEVVHRGGLYYLLNHNRQAVQLSSPVPASIDLLSNQPVAQDLEIEAFGVRILRPIQ